MTEPWLVYAGIAVWIGLGGYLAFLAASQRSLARKIAQLESLNQDSSDN